jgi:4-hydroxybenzoate polyprenyltransferase
VIEIGAWCLAALFLGIACVLLWFFLKLFFRLALFLIALSFLIVFLYQYSLLPESVLQHAEEAFFDVKNKLLDSGWLSDV